MGKAMDRSRLVPVRNADYADERRKTHPLLWELPLGMNSSCFSDHDLLSTTTGRR
jgi:hypothetical protein